MRSGSRTRHGMTRRVATVMAAIGALLMSSGIALMAASGPADATGAGGGHHVTLKDYVCKYVGTPGVDERLKNGNDGLVWVDSHASQGTWFKDAQGRSFVLLANVPRLPKPDASQCPVPEIIHATASLNLVDPTCDNENTATFTIEGTHAKVLWVKVNGHKVEASLGEPVTVDPGAHVKAMVLAADHLRFENGKPFMFLEGTLGAEIVDCTAVTPGAPTFVEPTCTTAPAVQTPTSELVTYEVTGTVAAGQTVTVVATLVDSETSHFAEGATTTWEHTFIEPTGCTVVQPPVVQPPAVQPPVVSPPTTKAKHQAQVTTPTVVSAGLAGDTTAGSSREQQGLALVATGLLLMAAAGATAFRRGGAFH